MNQKHKISIVFSFLIFITCINIYSQDWTNAGFIVNPGVRPSVSVVDGPIAWVADGAVDTPKVFRTTNYGVNWVSMPVDGITQEIYCIWSFSINNAIVGEGTVNGNAKMFLTNNAGTNWNVVAQTNPNQGYFNGLAFPKFIPSVNFQGLAVAERIYRTTDGGNNWTMMQSGVNGVSNAQNSLMIVDNNFYGFGLNNGAARIRLTTNNAVSWINQSVNITGSYTCAIAFKEDKLTGVVATSTSMPFIARTTDGGITWVQIDIGPGVTGVCKIKWVLGTDVVYIMGENGGIKRSLDGGITWNSMSTAGAINLTHFDFIKASSNVIYGYAVSRDGNVIKLADSIIIIITRENNNSSKIPSEYKLEQNYPNPFNPTTVINYQLPVSNYVKLVVYDLLGQEVLTLVNEKQAAGNHKVVFDGSNISSGVYFYKLTAGNDFTETKKIILNR